MKYTMFALVVQAITHRLNAGPLSILHLQISGGSRSNSSTTTNSTTNSLSTLTMPTVMRESMAYNGKFRRMITKIVKMPGGREFEFDIVSNRRQAGVTMLCWCTLTRTATLVREFHVGCEQSMLGTVNGCYEPNKHRYKKRNTLLAYVDV